MLEYLSVASAIFHSILICSMMITAVLVILSLIIVFNMWLWKNIQSLVLKVRYK